MTCDVGVSSSLPPGLAGAPRRVGPVQDQVAPADENRDVTSALRRAPSQGESAGRRSEMKAGLRVRPQCTPVSGEAPRQHAYRRGKQEQRPDPGAKVVGAGQKGDKNRCGQHGEENYP